MSVPHVQLPLLLWVGARASRARGLLGVVREEMAGVDVWVLGE